MKNKRLRLTVHRTNKYINAQIIDDAGKTLVSVSEKSLTNLSGSKTDKAKKVGLEIAKLALGKKIKKIYFDRSKKIYHGRVKALAEGARKGGLDF